MFAVGAFGVSLLAIRFASGHQIPDPNDPDQLDVMDAQVLVKNLKAASEVINDRVARGQVSDRDGQKMLSEYADLLISRVEIEHITEKDAWRYADIYRTGRKWDLAKGVYEIALRRPATEDRRINDTLRYAQCLAHLGEVKQALEAAKQAFDAKPDQSAPILPAMLLEIAPAAKGKGVDKLLAEMLLEASKIHSETVVDVNKKEGIVFRYARPFHIRSACKLAAQLFVAAGDSDGSARANALSEQLAPRQKI